MNALSQKETGFLNDAKTHEQLCIEKYNKYSTQASDPNLKTLFQGLSQNEQHHLDSINQILSGTIPNINASQSQPQPPQMATNQANLNKQNDSYLCQDALSMEKHVRITSYNVCYTKLLRYAWINQNSYRYGLVQRYKKEKASITEIDNEPWHFRYVGQPHAFIMEKNNFCFEEYIEYLKKFTFGKNHLQITNFDDVKYEIYYVPAEENVTKVPLPKDKEYSVSGT